MFNQIFGLIGRKLSAHLLTTCIFFILILVVLIGGAIQAISSLAFSAYVENSPHESSSSTRNSAVSSTSEPLSLMLDGETDTVFGAALRFNKSASNGYVNPSKSQNGIYASMKNDRDKSNAGRNSFSNTKILYKAYNGLSGGVDVMDKSSASSSSSSSATASSSANGKSRTINSTVYKSVTPSITDRVIADLKKEEYLNQQRSKLGIDGDGIEVGENDEAIYIDGDDEEEANTPSSTITEIETNIEKLPDDSIPELKSNSATADNAKQKKVPQTIVGIRDKKSSKEPALIISQKFKNFGFVDISDSVSSEAVDIDDDDYDDYFNSGSGDFSSQLVEQINGGQQTDWIAPTIEKIKAKKLNKQERILKSFADNSYGMGDSSQEMDTDAMDFIDKDNDQMISRKIAKAHKKQTAAQQQQQQQQQQQTPTKAENQKSKTKQNNRLKSNTNNKRKSKEQRYIDEYFSGTNTGNSAEGAEAELVKNGWMEPRIRRILGNIKKSEERSQQILLCKGEGELCSMLFKTPIKPVATP